MQNYFNQLHQSMVERIQVVDSEHKSRYYLKVIEIIENSLNELKTFFLSIKEVDDQDEIYYFKYLKPTIVSKLIVYQRLRQLEIEKPHGTFEDKIEQLELELKRYTRYFKANKDFVQYIRSENTSFDARYFIRKNAKLYPITESFSCEIDYQHGTGYDYRLAVLKAHEELEFFIYEQLDAIKNPSHKNNFEILSPYDSTCGTKKLNWTISQADLVELIYGLYTMKAFNHGRSEIKEIAEFLEEKFNVKLNNVYRSFSDIKNRKSVDRFKFISQMLGHLDNISDETLMSNDKN